MAGLNHTTNDLIFAKLAEGLDSTSKLTRALLEEIKESESDFATIKTELFILRDNVKKLTSIITEGNGSDSILTKIALLGKKLEIVDKWIDNHIELHQDNSSEIIKITQSIATLANRLSKIEDSFNELIEEMREKERDERVSIIQEQDFNLTRKKVNENIREERQKAIIRFLVAFIMAVIAGSVAYFTR